MSVRQEKISSLIQETLSNIFLQKVIDPELGMVTITKTKISPDLKIAKVYLSIYDKSKRDYVLEHIELMKGFLRSELARRANLKYTPELNFYIDDTLDYVEKMDKIFNTLKKNDNEQNETN